MRRSCPHCGQEQVIADAEIQAPWIFTRCHECESLSILRKEGAREPVASKKLKAAPAPAPEPKIAAPLLAPERIAIALSPLRKPALTAPRTPSLAARDIRPEAVLGAFASAARERPEAYHPPVLSASFDDEQELTLPSYFSPYNAEAETVVFKTPPATPAFLKRARSDAPQESALEPLAQSIREEARPKAELVEAKLIEEVPGSDEFPELPELDLDAIIDEDFPRAFDEKYERKLEALLAAPASATSPGGAPEQSAPPPADGSSSSKRRQRFIGVGALLIGVGFGLLVLKPRPRAPEPEPEHIPAFAPQPAAFVPVKPAPILVPPAAPPAPVPPSPADLASATAARVPSGFWIVSVSGVKTSLRAGPGKDFKVLGEAETGSRWKVRKWDGEWFQVEPENLGPETLGIGWIRNDLVKPVGNGGSF